MKNVEMDKRFIWLDWVYTLLKELNTTDEKIYEKNYIGCLNWMSYFYQKNKVEQNKKGNI